MRATHFVAEIVHGCNAFCVIERKIEDCHQETTNSLPRLALKKIAQSIVKGNQLDGITNVRAHFYADTQLRNKSDELRNATRLFQVI
jgi:hypothetical protein